MPDQLDLYDLRRREVQALGAALSCRDWHMMETAYNSLRDKLDRAGFTVAGPPATLSPPALDPATVAPSCAPGAVERIRDVIYRYQCAAGLAAEDAAEDAHGISDAIIAALSPQGLDAKEGERLTIKQAWDELLNVDDRTSPEEYPDMCLITRDELADFMERATASQRLDAATVERVRDAAKAWGVFVTARTRMNEAIPALDASTAERALYDERYKTDHEAEREHYRTACQLAKVAGEILAALATDPHQHGGKGA